MSYLQTKTFFLFFILFFLPFINSCGQTVVCEGVRGDLSLDPNGSTCNRMCECNNQVYEGACVDGTCISVKRGECPAKGKKQECIPHTIKQGECGRGFQVCEINKNKELFWGDCVPHAILPENTFKTCVNGKDDDCDGKVDQFDEGCKDFCKIGAVDHFCYTGKLETFNRGRCTSGIRICQKDNTWGKCVGENLPQKEVCNRKDDDCDGRIDEDLKGCESVPCVPDTIAPCYRHEKGCTKNLDGSFSCKGICRTGTKICLKDKRWGSCKGEMFPKEKEYCNKQDDNCDGFVDEGCPCKSDQDCPQKTNCKDQKCVPVAVCKEGSKRPCYHGPAGTKDVGSCTSGQQYCESGFWGQCLGETKPERESCDGLDNDCDGKIDNGLIRPFCSKQFGVCKRSRKICGGKKGWLPCSKVVYEGHDGNYVEDERDICDGLDNDCDGSVDEGCNCKDGSQRSCYAGKKGTEGFGDCKAGKQTCHKGSWGNCVGQITPATEICDGKDNNCDGYIDENFPDNGVDCQLSASVQKGECRRGHWHCEKGQRVCKPANTKTSEVCDGKDNNCDGIIDNATTDSGKPCNVKGIKGPCEKGETICRLGKIECKQLIQPQDEICDGKDNDCDGLIDNIKGKQEPIYRPCYTGSKNSRHRGICKDGKQYCRNGFWSKDCLGQVVPEKKESCDGLDNDCDGLIDNSQNGVGSALRRECYTAKDPTTANKGLCKKGFEVCVSAKWQKCKDEIVPTTEICDGKDNNCNGQIDESFPDELKSCTIKNKVGVCAQGILKCQQGQKVCIGGNLPTTEICDGLDNDCDGQVDELPPIHCGVGECAVSMAGCTNGKISTCVPNPKGGESKNGKDNNCDGYVDKTQVTTVHIYAAKNYPTALKVDDTRKSIFVMLRTPYLNSNHRFAYSIALQQFFMVSQTSHSLCQKECDFPIYNFDFDPFTFLFYITRTSFIQGYPCYTKPLSILDKQGNIIENIGLNNIGFYDGESRYVRFNAPYGVTFDKSKKLLYIADSGNHRIRILDKKLSNKSSQYVRTLAGRGKAGFIDGIGNNAWLNSPRDVAVDSRGVVYVADYGNHAIRRIDPITKKVTTIAGDGKAGFLNGIGHNARFNHPFSLTFDRHDLLYVADQDNHAIRKIKIVRFQGRWFGHVTTLAGDGTAGLQNNNGKTAQFNKPIGISSDDNSNIFIADFENRAIRKITQ